MTRVVAFCLFLMGMLVLPMRSAENFVKVESWNHNEQILGEIWASAIDKDGNVIGRFFKCGGRIITPKEMVPFAPSGEAPSELKDCMGIFDYQGELGFLEMENSAKIFTKKGNTYVWKETLWFQRNKYPHFVNNVKYIDGKWFFAGEGYLNYHPVITKSFLIRVYDQKRRTLKELLNYEFRGTNTNYLKTQHLLDYKNQVFLISEDKLAVSVISVKDLTFKKEVKLEVPSWYKKAPADFFTQKKYPDGLSGFSRDIERWKTDYSRISKTGIDGAYIVMQLRTCNEKLARFCLLFYNADTFKLEKQFFSNDCFLGVRDNRYYFYRDGDPGLDDVSECVILVYKLDGKK